MTCWQPYAEPARSTETGHKTTVQFLLNLTEPAGGLAYSTLSTDLPTFFVDRFPSVKNDLSHKQKGELANLTRSIHACVPRVSTLRPNTTECAAAGGYTRTLHLRMTCTYC